MKASIEALVRPDLYQVFVLSCPAHIPFATHTWFVVNHRGAVSRWEITFRARTRPQSWGHVNKDLFPPFLGLPIACGLRWPRTLVGMVEGAEDSPAAVLVRLIESSHTTYPYRNRYRLWGPNSNTYPAYMLRQVPEVPIQLPWNALGKGFGTR